MNNTPEFKIIPDISDVSEIDRDLKFFPVENTSPQTLITDQITSFNRNGYLMPLEAFTEEEISVYRSFFDDVLAQALAEGRDSYSISTAHLAYGEVYDILSHPKIVRYVTDLLGNDVVGWGSHFFCKMPRDGKKVSWHQDASYWPLTPSKTVTVWLAIDDADVENACMQFIPASHHDGHLPYRTSDASENNVLNQTVDDISMYPDPVNVELRAGQLSMHNDLLLHGSNANESDRRRCGLTLRYCAADVMAYMGWNEKGVVVSGTANPSLWPGANRPS